MDFSFLGFKRAVSRDFLKNTSGLAYDWVNKKEFSRILRAIGADKKHLRIEDTFEFLKCRMDEHYYREMFKSQARAMYFASTHFPAYSFIIAEDLAEDWLACVDFHKQHARDHSLHQPLTAYIVAELLGYGNSAKSLRIPAAPGNLLDFCVAHLFDSTSIIVEEARMWGFPETLLSDSLCGRDYWKDLFYGTALISSLFHDIGYPWQYVGRITSSLEKCVEGFPFGKLETREILDAFGERLVLRPFHHYLRSFKMDPIQERGRLEKLVRAAMGTHGLPGALAFLSLNDSIRDFPAPTTGALINDFAMEWAAMGIMMHDMVDLSKSAEGNGLGLDFIKDPLSSIVAFADYLEEFNRPSVKFSSYPNKSELSYGTSCKSVQVSTDAQRNLVITMQYNTPEELVLARSFKEKETEDYFNRSSGFIDMSGLGIENVLFNAKSS